MVDEQHEQDVRATVAKFLLAAFEGGSAWGVVGVRVVRKGWHDGDDGGGDDTDRWTANSEWVEDVGRGRVRFHFKRYISCGTVSSSAIRRLSKRTCLFAVISHKNRGGG